ncbi:MAG: 16S rRNA processing protein RimM [Bacteroidia bacterium]|nr:16S rRNA processing protein RimM [Bacteroidia bacterium]
MSEHIFIGKLKKIHGLKGELYLELKEEAEIDFEEIKFLLLAEKNASPVPFFTSYLLPHSTGYLVKFENVNSQADAKQFLNRDVFAEDIFILQDEEENDLFSLQGYLVHDKLFGEVGKISSVLEMPGQLIFTVVHSSGKEILLPANEKMILSIDKINSVIEYEAPEGLIELYL